MVAECVVVLTTMHKDYCTEMWLRSGVTTELHGALRLVHSWVRNVWRVYTQNLSTHKMAAIGKRLMTSIKKIV